MPSSSPIIAKPADRDPLKNFKFRVDFIGNETVAQRFRIQSGFISISGLGIQTDMIPYREGGDNTITRKMPGQSDVGPLQLVRGLFMVPSAQYDWFNSVFAVNWGNGNTGFNDDFRCNAIIRVNKHPVTKWSQGGEGDPNSNASAGLAWKVYNCWPGALQYNDLNAGDNSIMVETMTLHHEGFETFYGSAAQGSLA